MGNHALALLRDTTTRVGIAPYRLTRPAGLRLAARRYDRNMRALHREHPPAVRAAVLETMAATASLISSYGPGSIEAENDWAARSEILRAIAATERFCILTDMWDYRDEGPRITGPEFRDRWAGLAAAAVTGDRRARAAILRGMRGEAPGAPGISVLGDIAAAELAIAEEQ